MLSWCSIFCCNYRGDTAEFQHISAYISAFFYCFSLYQGYLFFLAYTIFCLMAKSLDCFFYGLFHFASPQEGPISTSAREGTSS